MRLFGRRRSGPALEPRLGAYRAEQGGGHDLALLERRTEAALAESGLEWESEQLADERKWQVASERGPVAIFSSVRDDAVSLNQTIRHADELDLDDAFVRALLEGNAYTKGPYAALAETSVKETYDLLLQALIPVEALDAETLHSTLAAFLRQRELLESGEPEQWTEERFDVHIELDSVEEVLRAWVPVEAADGVRSELRLFSYFLERGGFFNSSFYAIVPYRSESWVAAMSTVPMESVTPASVAFALEHPLDSAQYWRNAK